MIGIRRLLKPWYVWRPWQLARRAQVEWATAMDGYRTLRVAWGVSLLADPRMTIGRSIQTTAVHDPTVTEILARLIRDGDTVVDAGAHVGYMTILAALAAGTSGHVVSWEPHAGLFDVLERNVARVRAQHQIARTTLRNAAVGSARGHAELMIRDDVPGNDGMSCIVRDSADLLTGRSIHVNVETIDDVLGDTTIALMKLDIEGAELAALRGASRALGAGRIRHIVFEDHEGPASEVTRFLKSRGYAIFAMGWSIRGLMLGPGDNGSLAAPYEAPSYLATLAPLDVQERCTTTGWMTLSRRFAQGRRRQ